MGIQIFQSELNAIGVSNFMGMRRDDRIRAAARALRASGRNNDAFLLEIKNVSAVNTLALVGDVSAGPATGYRGPVR